MFVSTDSVIFEGGKLLIYPDLGKRTSIDFDYSALNMPHAKSILNGEITDLSGISLVGQDSLFSSGYIFSNQEIHSTKFRGNPDLLVTTVGFPLYNRIKMKAKKAWLTHPYLADLSSKIISYNQNFIEGVLGQYATHRAKSIILVNDKDFAADIVGNKEADSAIVRIRQDHSHARIASFISHEYLHELFSTGDLSVKFGPKTNDGILWFLEGFTEYYAHLLNYRSGAISKLEYIEAINEMLEGYYTHYRVGQSEVSNPCTHPLFSSEILSKMTNFYASGVLIALDLDNIIRARSHNKLNLDDFLRNVVKSSCSKLPCRLSKEQFVKEMQNLWDSKQVDRAEIYVDTYVTNFIPIELPETLYEPKLTLSDKKLKHAYGLGFDDGRTFCDGVTHGVKEGGNAYKAGLRNGMKVRGIGMKLTGIRNGWRIGIEIENEDLSKRIINVTPLEEIMLAYYKVMN